VVECKAPCVIRPWLLVSMSDAVRYLGMHVDPPGGLADLGGMTLKALGGACY
jgi:hypothetical protein